MSMENKNLLEQYYKFWLWLANLKNKTNILTVDFAQKWTQLISKQKKYLFIAITAELATKIFYTLIPLILGFILQKQNVFYFYLLIVFWLLSICSEYLSGYFAAILEIQCISSIQFNAYNFFLTVDPIYHATKESGKIFAKIERCARAYEDFLDIILWDIAPTLISVTTVSVTFLFVEVKLGIIAFVSLIIIASVNILLNLFLTASFEKNIIQADDDFKNASTESLNQMQLIRSAFASNEISQQIKNKNLNFLEKEGTAWIAFGSVNFITRSCYLFSFFILGIYIISAANNNIISIATAITLLLTYLRGTYEVINIGRKIRKLLRAITRIRDLFSYIQEFGKQNFPVLITDIKLPINIKEAISKTNITLQAKDLYFDYNPKTKIFHNHSLYLDIDKTQENKLYGIIGPSGMGKTTLISILGGQLKPTSGQINLNNIDIYAIDDETRKHIIALQSQSATNLSGSLRRNLIIGLPPEELSYYDEEIIDTLKQVGIWHIFEEKECLDTNIGEGGLNLSGGQRQRLNFSSLFLRAKYYNPLLILIDEPTSSLDEISEKAITDMINKLAKNALTLVIAHRLKTLDNAVGILDFSLIDQEKKIIFYPPEELKKRSNYYTKLLEGQINIEIGE